MAPPLAASAIITATTQALVNTTMGEYKASYQLERSMAR